MDKRIIKTRKKIQDAFIVLLEKNKLEQISVSNICQKAKINRGTFYLHYQDKYDLLEQIEKAVIDDIGILRDGIVDQFEKGNLPFYDRELMITILLKLYEKISDNALFIKTILSINGDLNFQNQLHKYSASIIIENLTKNNDKVETRMPINYLAAMIAEVQLGIIKEWLNNDQDRTPYELAIMVSEVYQIFGKNLLIVKE